MQKITKIYYSSFNKALGESFHQNIYQIIADSGLAQDEDIKEVCGQYKVLIDELQALVAYSKAFESTPAIKEAMQSIEIQYRYMFRIFRSFNLDHRIVSEEEYSKLKREVLDMFPLTLLRQSWSHRLGSLEVFVTHLRNDWMPLLEKTELMDCFLSLEQQVANLCTAIIDRTQEKSQIEVRKSLRILKELFETYQQLGLFIEAWSNTDYEEPSRKLRHQKSLDVLHQINKLISSTLHSLAVARSNRRRATSQE